MAWLRRNVPPTYDYSATYEDNFPKFFDWALSLKDPARMIPDIADRLGFGVRRHPIGFIAVYVSRRDPGWLEGGVSGIARVNICPRGVGIKDDIHCHGFNFVSGNVGRDTFINTLYFPDWSASLPDGEGYVGYETSVDPVGVNHAIKATDATVSIPRSQRCEVGRGEIYRMKPREDFHSISPGDGETVTIFCKEPTSPWQEGLSLVLKRPDEPPPPETY